MQNKGIVKFITLLLVLVCIFYLSFSFVTSHYENKAAAMGEEAGQEYLDSIMNEKVYLGIYSLKQCREMEIGLGLDLKGGMNVVLEVSVPDVIAVLADHKTDPAFTKSMAEARQEEETSQDDFISLFVKSFHKNAPGRRLAEIFATQQMKGKVSTQSTDAEVERALRAEVQSAVDNSFNVVRNRIDKFGVVQPNIQKMEGQTGRIMVEMPGIKEPERVRKLLQGSANLEFWETYNSQEVLPALMQLNQRYAALDTTAAATAPADTTKAEAAPADTAKASLAAALASKGTAQKADAKGASAEAEQLRRQNPLLAVFQPVQGQSLSVVGYASARDTAEVNKIIYSDIARQVLPADLKLLWSAKAVEFDKTATIFELHAIKVTEPSGRAPLEGNVITSARDSYTQMGQPCVTMQMNSDGARRWAQLTKANIGRAIAIVLDGTVYSAPRVNSEISGGNSEITGNFTIEETKDLANTLNSGKMPAPTRIVQEEVVGPSLGMESIEQGFVSFVIAFIVLMAYLIVLYNFIPGMVANMALLFNLFFTLGIMTSFQSVLTMPGIAGLLLSLGMAVDANVLIHERAKEELANGIGVKEAINRGYTNAFSAIFDSNLTSIITGVILFVFGTGPIRGFATTFIIGLCCSFFTAVYMTRMVYDHQLKRDKWLNLTFTTAISRNMLQNTKINFMGKYKASFATWAIISLVFIGSFAVRGFSEGIDFTGGRNYVLQFEQPVEPESVREVLQGAFGEATCSAIALGTDKHTIRVTTNYKIESNNPDVDNEIENILYQKLHAAGLVTQKDVNAFKNPDVRAGGSIISSSKVGPAVAKDITYGAIVSVVIAIIAIFLYILLRFRNVAFSLGSTVALALDTLFVLGVYSLLWGVLPMSMEIDQTFIGAILTVIGYSINDKVVVFDRIRENMHLYTKRNLWALFNDSLNQTLARTINTGSATLLVLLIIIFFGGESIRSFSLAMILGIVFGTFSSIFIAAPVAYFTMGKKLRNANAPVAEAKA